MPLQSLAGTTDYHSLTVHQTCDFHEKHAMVTAFQKFEAGLQSSRFQSGSYCLGRLPTPLHNYYLTPSVFAKK